MAGEQENKQLTTELSPEQQNQMTSQKKYEAVKQELDEVKGNDSNKREINKDVLKGNLDGEFGEFLKKEPIKLKALQDGVDKIKNDPNLSQRAGDALKTLKQFLKDIQNEESKDDFEEFNKKLDNVSSLSSMHDYEIRRACLYIQGNVDAAFKIYGRMKNLKNNEKEYNGLEGQDKEYFDNVWDALKNYSNSDELFGKVYGNVEPKVDSLKGLLKNFDLGKDFKWNGDTLLAIPEQKGTIFSRECIVKNFNKVNTARIEANKDYISKNIKIDDKMKKEQFQDEIKKLSDGKFVQFVDENEISRYVEDKWKEVESQRNQVKLNSTIGLEYNIEKDKVETNVLTAINKVVPADFKFIDKDDKGNYSVSPENASKYLLSLKSEKDPNNLKSWNDLKSLPENDGNRQAWIAAVQVLLSNVTYNNKTELKIDGKFDQKDKDNATMKEVRNFQESNPEIFGKGKGVGHRVDGLPGPVTIDALTKNRNNASSAERAKTIEDNLKTTLDLKEASQNFNKGNYGIEEGSTVYEFDVNGDIYYRSGNDVYKVSSDAPWERQKAILNNGNIEWQASQLHVCKEGADKMKDGLKTIDSNIAVASVDGKYKLTKGDISINIDANDPVLFKEDGFCGKKGIMDRIKLVALVAEVKGKCGDDMEYRNGPYLPGFAKKDAPTTGNPEITISSLQNYGFNNANSEEIKSFVDYCNNLVKDKDNNYMYKLEEQTSNGGEKEEDSKGGKGEGTVDNDNVDSGEASSGGRRGRRRGSVGYESTYASSRGSSGGNIDVNVDPEDVGKYGFRSITLSSREKNSLNLGNRNIYTTSRNRSVYYYKCSDSSQRDMFMAVYKSCPYVKVKTTYEKNSLSVASTEMSFNVCDSGLNMLKGLWGADPNDFQKKKGYYTYRDNPIQLNFDGKKFTLSCSGLVDISKNMYGED